MRTIIASVCLALCVAGCGDSSSGGSVTAPGPAATSIAVTVRDVVLVGTTAVATATATLSNGQQQPVTSGWRSDATTVATVTGAGIVTGIGNGEASIAVAFDGREGAKRIRVAPNYDGQWHGLQVVTACTASGGFSGACEEGGGVVGERFPVALSARQPGDLSVAGEFSIEGITFPTFSAQVEGDGTIRFSSLLTVEQIRADVSWVMRSENTGIAGTIRERYSAPGVIAGEVLYDSNLSTFTRGSAAVASDRIARSRLAALATRIQGLGGR